MNIEPVAGFDLHSAAILLHVILFAYWLGGDLGVFYSSRHVVNPQVPISGRLTAMRIMHVADLAPRVCLILMLPSGMTLMAATPLGEDLFYGWPLIVAWIFSLIWLGTMVVAYFRSPAKHADLAARADWLVRTLFAIGLLGTAAYALVVDEPFGATTNPTWLAAKVAAYGMCVVCGLMIRVSLRPFGPAFSELMTTGSTPAVEAALSNSMRRALPWVLSIWSLVLLAAILGVFKPGTTALG